jgi:hypothetical protein
LRTYRFELQHTLLEPPSHVHPSKAEKRLSIFVRPFLCTGSGSSYAQTIQNPVRYYNVRKINATSKRAHGFPKKA